MLLAAWLCAPVPLLWVAGTPTSKRLQGSAFASSDPCCLHSGAWEVTTVVPRAHFWSLAAQGVLAAGQ